MTRSISSWFRAALLTHGVLGCTGAIDAPSRSPSPGTSLPASGQPAAMGQPNPSQTDPGAGALPPSPAGSMQAPAAAPATGAPGGGMREPTPAITNISCDGMTNGATPRRLWRLTGTQYVNTVAAFLTKRIPSGTQIPSAPKSVTSPIEAENTAERFRNFASVYALSDFEVRRGIGSAAETAAALVTSLRKTTSSCLGGTANRPAFDVCMKSLVDERGPLLFSRPLPPEEVADYVAVATSAVPTIGADDAAALTFQAMMMSPSFLFRSELGDGKVDAKGVVQLTAYEIAAALSYTLVDGPPDVELWKAATTGQLATVDQIRAQAVRLIGTLSARSSTTLRFLREYFEYDGAARVFKDVPKYDPVALGPRTMEAGKPIDASGVLTGAGSQDGAFSNAAQLMNRLSVSPVAEQCFVRHAFRYWMGRNEQAWDGCSLATAQEAYRKSNGDYREIILAFVTSPSFLNRSAR